MPELFSQCLGLYLVMHPYTFSNLVSFMITLRLANVFKCNLRWLGWFYSLSKWKTIWRRIACLSRESLHIACLGEYAKWLMTSFTVFQPWRAVIPIKIISDPNLVLRSLHMPIHGLLHEIIKIAHVQRLRVLNIVELE